MTRAVKEWVGKSDDTPIPPRVKLRVFQKASGLCELCTRKLFPGHWEADHVVALINGGQNCESNLQALCDIPCHNSKTKTDVKEKADTYRVRLKHSGIRRPKQPFRGWRKMNGTVVFNPKDRR